MNDPVTRFYLYFCLTAFIGGFVGLFFGIFNIIFVDGYTAYWFTEVTSNWLKIILASGFIGLMLGGLVALPIALIISMTEDIWMK